MHRFLSKFNKNSRVCFLGVGGGGGLPPQHFKTEKRRKKEEEEEKRNFFVIFKGYQVVDSRPNNNIILI